MSMPPALPYPPVRYSGDGEVSATARRVDAEPDLVYASGVRVSYLSSGASTEGLFGLYRWDFSDAETGPGPHFHRTLTESFFVLSGTVRIYDGREWVRAHSGDYVHVPAGGIHGFRNEADAPASMLLHFAPGAPREGYFEGLASFATDGRPDEPTYAEFMAAHDNVWLE